MKTKTILKYATSPQLSPHTCRSLLPKLLVFVVCSCEKTATSLPRTAQKFLSKSAVDLKKKIKKKDQNPTNISNLPFSV